MSCPKRELLKILLEKSLTIVFTKKDGTEREMYCTLNESEIPKDQRPKGTGKEKNEDVLSVYDITNKGWRSFRTDSIKSIKYMSK